MPVPSSSPPFPASRLRRSAPAVTVLLAAALAGPAPALAAPATGAVPAIAVPEQAHPVPRTVTLITGDRVTTTGDRPPTITPGPGRAGMSFVVTTVGGRRSVVPSDAAALVRAGRVDPRLFDITGLLDQGLDRAGHLPLIVSSTGEDAEPQARATVTATGGTAGRELPAVHGLAVRAEVSRTDELWDGLTGRSAAREDRPTTTRGGVRKIWLDGVSRLALERSVPQIGAPTAWAAGYDGRGLTVAVLDSGVDAEHPDLAGKVVAVRDFVDAGPGDAVGHGTHVASILAGTGAASGGRFRGVAPGAVLADGKVCNSAGECPDSATLAGMEWAAAQLRAPIVNMSLGGADSEGVDPLEEAVANLSAAHGTLFVVAAGNNGGVDGHPFTIGTPGAAVAALTVGAVDGEDRMADFSSRGPRLGDRAIKPDVVAPGVDITAARASTNIIPDGGSGPYMTISGTSMATPHVAGAAAVLLQRRPGATGEQLKRLLMSSAQGLPGVSAYAQGSGRVDVARAVDQTVSSLGNVDLGRQAWPHDDDETLTGTIGYRNGGDEAVVLDLAPSAVAPDGTAGPAGTLALDAPSLTVPAGGTATVGVTWSLPADAPTGLWSGRVVATAGRVQVQTALGVQRAQESYPLSVQQLDRDGRRPAEEDGFVTLFGYDGVVQGNIGPSTETVQVPPGDYYLAGFQRQRGEGGERVVLLVARQVRVTGPTSITFDGREAREVDVRVPERGATPVYIDAMTEIEAPEGLRLGVVSVAGAGARLFTGSVRADGDRARPRSDVAFRSALVGEWARPDAAGGFSTSPSVTHGAWYREGSMFKGLRRRLTDDLVATVVQDLGRNRLRTGQLSFVPDLPGVWESGALVLTTDVRLPTRQVHRFASDGRPVAWAGQFRELVPTPDGGGTGAFYSDAVPQVHEAGRRTSDSWNVPVYGPVNAPRSVYPELAVYGELLVAAPTLTGDRGGHVGYQATFDAARTVVERDGTVVGDEPSDVVYADVPRGAADYRIRSWLDRTSTARLSTRVNTTWRFRSAPTVGDERIDLPVSVVRLLPAVDRQGRLTGPGPVRIPVAVTRQGAAGQTRLVTVQVSGDDGRTWSDQQQVRLDGNGRGTAVFASSDVPLGPVSLRATAVDALGGSVDQKVIRAFVRR